MANASPAVAPSQSVLNLGSGRNPLPGATNLDIRGGRGVDVVGDAAALPFPDNSFDEIVAVNPFGFSPVTAETARVLAPGGRLVVTGFPGNPTVAAVAELSSEDVGSLGFRIVDSRPARPSETFGLMTRTDGSPITEFGDFRTYVFESTG